MSKKHHQSWQPGVEQVPMGLAPLRPGSHVIDGVAVEVTAEEGKEWAAYPLPVGQHIIDEVMVRVEAPGHGIQVPFTPVTPESSEPSVPLEP